MLLLVPGLLLAAMYLILDWFAVCPLSSAVGSANVAASWNFLTAQRPAMNAEKCMSKCPASA